MSEKQRRLLVDAYPVEDKYADGLGRMEVTGQNVRFVFYTGRPRDGGEYDREVVARLASLYFKSKGEDEFLSLAKESQRARRNSLEESFKVPLSDTDQDPMGDCPLKYLSAQKMKRIIEAIDGRGARANRRKHLSALCAWGVEI